MASTLFYRTALQSLPEWDEYLRGESGLPGPRGNLELAQAVADLGDEARFRRYAALTPDQAPVNSPDEFLAFCGVLGYGKLLAEGQAEMWPLLRAAASDRRWRLREATAMALQRMGDADMPRLLEEMARWVEGSALEQRAAAAALCEPRLLRLPEHACRVLELLDAITASLVGQSKRKDEAFLILRQGLAYCWSVAVAAQPEPGKQRMERWLSYPDRDVRWLMSQNLKKKRLARVDPAWVAAWQQTIASGEQ